MILSILIPSLTERADKLHRLLSQLKCQIGYEGNVQVLTAVDNRQATTGRKRQQLLEAAEGDYVVSIDDDDEVDMEYIPLILQASRHYPDCIGFKGWLTYRRRKEEWIISNALPYKDATIDGKKVYLRHTNHLAPVKREIALQVGFPDKTREEDHAYAMGLRGLLHTEVFIPKHLYIYQK